MQIKKAGTCVMFLLDSLQVHCVADVGKQELAPRTQLE